MSDSIFAQIAAIAAPVVQHYHDDVAVHDKAALAGFGECDSALWCCYDCGSHFVRLTWAAGSIPDGERAKATRQARNWFQAVESVFGYKRLAWYLLDGKSGEVRPIAYAEAEELYRTLDSAIAAKRAA